MTKEKMILNGHSKKYNFFWKVFSFSSLVPRATFRFPLRCAGDEVVVSALPRSVLLFTLCEMHPEMVLLHFFERSGTVSICVADNTIAMCI